MTIETASVDPRLASSKEALARKIAEHCRGRALDRQTVHDCEEIARDHRAWARLDGVDFPELVPLVMDVQRRIRMVRRDLDRDAVDNLAVELAMDQRARGYYDPAEVARAVRRAFPHHRAPDAGDK